MRNRIVRLLPVLLVLLLVLGACGANGLSGRTEGNKVTAYVRDAGDLVAGGTVQIKDIEVGSVNDIELVLKDGVMQARVTMILDPEVRVPVADLRAVIRQTSLLGEQFVELLPAEQKGPYLGASGGEIPLTRTTRRVDVETFLADLSGFIGNGGLEDLNQFTHAQALILEQRGEQLGETIGELETFTGLLANRRLDISSAIDNLASAGGTLAKNKDKVARFLGSLKDASALLADQGDELTTLFRSLRRFGSVSSRFLAKNEKGINRQLKALRPVFRGLAGAEGDLRADISQLRTFFKLFPRSIGGGPGDAGEGDYVQVEAVLCEALDQCQTAGEKGEVYTPSADRPDYSGARAP